MTTRLFFAALVAALGGLLFGFDTAVISGAEGTLQKLYADQYASLGQACGGMGLGFMGESFWHGFLVASALFGTIVGAVLFGKPADKYGRRAVLFWLAGLYFISAVGSALAIDATSFILFRFIGGLGVGGASVVSPLYVAEISPARLRGRLVALVQLNIVLGILLAYLSNYLIDQIGLGEATWRWMFGVEAVPAAAFGLLLVTNPLSPRWLVAQGRDEEARTVLSEVGTDSGQVDEEIKSIQASLDLARHQISEPFFQGKYAVPIMLVVAIAMFNQLSGINALIYYTKRIFEMAGASGASALLQSVVIGITNLIFTLAAMAVIDHFGRRKLMIVGSIGYIISLSVTAAAFHWDIAANPAFGNVGGWIVLGSLIVFIASHAFGQGAVIWVFIGEIFPNRVRARGQALGSFTHWIMAAAISLTFPMIAERSGAAIFAFYAVCMVGQLIWVLTAMPETKGVPLEEIQRKLGIE